MRFTLAFILYIVGGFGFIPFHRLVINEKISGGFMLSLIAILGLFFCFPLGVGLVLFKILYEGELVMQYQEPIQKPKVDIGKLLDDMEQESYYDECDDKNKLSNIYGDC